MSRPSWDEWALNLAEAVSTRADCTRRSVGVVILDWEHRIVSTGYNGAEPGGPSCLKGDCPRGRHYQVDDALRNYGLTNGGQLSACLIPVCACGQEWPCQYGVAPGSSYDTGIGSCIALHAEQNALMYAERLLLDKGTMYITDEPCAGCLKLIRNTRLSRVVWPGGELCLTTTRT